MEVFFTILYRNYIRKNDMEEPPPLDDGDSYTNGNKPGKEIPTHKKHDKLNLEEKYYRYGVQPEWLQIQVGYGMSMLCKDLKKVFASCKSHSCRCLGELLGVLLTVPMYFCSNLR